MSFMAFLSAFISYLLVFVVFVAVIAVAVFLGIFIYLLTHRKKGQNEETVAESTNEADDMGMNDVKAE